MIYEWLLLIALTGNNGNMHTDNLRLSTEQECQAVGLMYRNHYAGDRKITTSCIKVLEKNPK